MTNQDKFNFLFTTFEYNIDDNGAVPTDESYVKQNVYTSFVKSDISDVKFLKVIFNGQVNTNRNTTPIQTQAMLKAYSVLINQQQRHFFIDKQNILQIYLQNQGQVAQKFLEDISIPAETIVKVFNQFWQDIAISLHIQVQIECVY